MAFVYFCLPETKDRLLEELDEMFRTRYQLENFSHMCALAWEPKIRHLETEKVNEEKKTVMHIEAA